MLKKRLIKNASIRVRLLKNFILVSVIPIFIIGVISFYISSSTLEKTVSGISQQLLVQAGGKIDSMLSELEKVCVVAESNNAVQNQIRKKEYEINDDFSGESAVEHELSVIQSGYPQIISIGIVGKNGGKYKSSFMSTKDVDLRGIPEYKDVMNSEDKAVWFYTRQDSFAVEKSSDDNIFVLGKTIRDKFSGEVAGAIFVDINERYIYDMIKDVKIGDAGNLLVVDAAGNVITSAGKDNIVTNIKEQKDLSNILNHESSSFRTSIGGQNYLVINYASEYTNWKLIGYIPLKEITKESVTIGIITLIIGLLFVVMAFVIAIRISGYIGSALGELKELMHKAQHGDTTTRVDIKRHDEFGDVGNSFNVMMENFAKVLSGTKNAAEDVAKNGMLI